MDMEARSFSQEKSQQLMRKVKEYKSDLKKITEDSKAAQGSASGTLLPHCMHSIEFFFAKLLKHSLQSSRSCLNLISRQLCC